MTLQVTELPQGSTLQKQKPTPVYGMGFLKGYEFGIRVVHFKSTQRTDGFYLEFEPPVSGNLFVFYLRPYQKFHYHIQTMVNTSGDNTLGIPYKVTTFFFLPSPSRFGFLTGLFLA